MKCFAMGIHLPGEAEDTVHRLTPFRRFPLQPKSVFVFSLTNNIALMYIHRSVSIH